MCQLMRCELREAEAGATKTCLSAGQFGASGLWVSTTTCQGGQVSSRRQSRNSHNQFWLNISKVAAQHSCHTNFDRQAFSLLSDYNVSKICPLHFIGTPALHCIGHSAKPSKCIVACIIRLATPVIITLQSH